MTYEKLVRNIGAEVEISKDSVVETFRGKRGTLVLSGNAVWFKSYEEEYTSLIPAEDYILLSPSPSVSYTEEDLRDMARVTFQEYDQDTKAFYEFSGRLKEIFRELGGASVDVDLPF